MTTVAITFPGAAGGRVTGEVRGLEGLGADGLVLSRAPWPSPGHDSSGGSAGLLLPRSVLVRVALELAERHPQVGPIVIWPRGVPAEQAAVALAVGALLHAHRPVGGAPPVTCAARPPTRRTRPVLRHLAHVTSDRDVCGSGTVERTVWEVMTAGVPAALAAGVDVRAAA